MQAYFFSIIEKISTKKNKLKKYNEYCLAEYLCEFLLFFKAFLYDKNENFDFDKNNLLKKFNKIFEEESNNNIEISVIKIKQIKKNYVLVSFLSTIFKTFKIREKNENKKMNSQSLNGIIRYYPELMKKIVELNIGN